MSFAIIFKEGIQLEILISKGKRNPDMKILASIASMLEEPTI
jgi:hypothetical protein